jgi:methionyl-tRNA formyltransferase
MNYLLFANPITGRSIIKGLTGNPPSVVVTFLQNRDNWKNVLLRFLKGKHTLEDQLRYFNNIEYYDYYSLTPTRLSRIINTNKIEIGFITTFSKIIPNNLIQQFPKGLYNIHPSLLPYHGGANPLFWIIYNADEYTGTTCHKATSNLDEGPILYQIKYKVLNRDSSKLFNLYIRDCNIIISEMINNYSIHLDKSYSLDQKTIFDDKLPTIDYLRAQVKNGSDKKRINRALRIHKLKI